MEYSIGELLPVSSNGGTDETPIYLVPPAGYEWLILNAYGQHNNVANTAHSWGLVTPAANQNFQTQTTATWGQLVLGASVENRVPFKITPTHYLQLSLTLEAGKYQTIRAIVLQRPLNYDLLFQEFIAHRLGFRLPISSRE